MHQASPYKSAFQPKAVIYAGKYSAISFEVVENVPRSPDDDDQSYRKKLDSYLHRVMIIGAVGKGNGTYEWADKTPGKTIRLSLDYADTADLNAVLLGLRKEHHFKRSDHGMEVQWSDSQLAFRMSQGSSRISVTSGAQKNKEDTTGDIVRVSAIALLALQRQMRGLDGTLMMQALRGAYRGVS